jgi:hypothetical protein
MQFFQAGRDPLHGGFLSLQEQVEHGVLRKLTTYTDDELALLRQQAEQFGALCANIIAERGLPC